MAAGEQRPETIPELPPEITPLSESEHIDRQPPKISDTLEPPPKPTPERDDDGALPD